ncbi:MAG: ABC-F family ATP-binding cassette domain-containing protein, partial [Verrucomicrobiales bacterium]|nr:ABC-F family ATP-binding cassette domain-containing protein [Verrucomicrobiales bacterium]
ILGQITPTAGTVELDGKRQVGYYDQEHRELDPNRKVVDEIRRIRHDMSEETARNYLARFLFVGNDVFKPLGKLSGGEQSRVRLARLILEGPDVLILDEPTNHLDIPSREALEEALLEFEGTLITISHDRYFLDQIVEKLLVIRPEGSRLFAGNYSTYIETVEREEAQRDAAAQRAAAGARKEKNRDEKPAKADQPAPQKKKTASKYDHLSAADLEAMIIERESSLSALNTRFADPAVFRDPAALADLNRQLTALRRELTEIETAWHERAE